MSPLGKLFCHKEFEFLKSDLCSPSYGPFTLNSLVEGLSDWVCPAGFNPAGFTPDGSPSYGPFTLNSLVEWLSGWVHPAGFTLAGFARLGHPGWVCPAGFSSDGFPPDGCS